MFGELSEMFGVKWGEVRQEDGPVAKVLGDSGVGVHAADGGEDSLLLEELKGGVELAVEEEEFGLVTFWVTLHLGLQRWEAQFLGGPAGGRERLRIHVLRPHCLVEQSRRLKRNPRKTLEGKWSWGAAFRVCPIESKSNGMGWPRCNFPKSNPTCPNPNISFWASLILSLKLG